MSGSREGGAPFSALRRTAQWRGLVALVAVATLAAGVAQTGAGHALLRRTGLFEEPTSYTSLAFQNSQPPPAQLPARRASVKVPFVIRNASDTAHTYQWSLLLVQGRHTRRVAAGSVGVAARRQVVIARSAKIFCARGQVEIVVSLAHPAEYIDAHVTCSSRKS
jgi:hypothetical protein